MHRINRKAANPKNWIWTVFRRYPRLCITHLLFSFIITCCYTCFVDFSLLKKIFKFCLVSGLIVRNLKMAKFWTMLLFLMLVAVFSITERILTLLFWVWKRLDVNRSSMLFISLNIKLWTKRYLTFWIPKYWLSVSFILIIIFLSQSLNQFNCLFYEFTIVE